MTRAPSWPPAGPGPVPPPPPPLPLPPPPLPLLQSPDELAAAAVAAPGCAGCAGAAGCAAAGVDATGGGGIMSSNVTSSSVSGGRLKIAQICMAAAGGRVCRGGVDGKWRQPREWWHERCRHTAAASSSCQTSC
eukprot:363272-Chlamydomonas_euryale.AAC.3